MLSERRNREIDQARVHQSRQDLIHKARLAISARRRRTIFLSKSMFGEPAWDMLLHLYASPEASLTLSKLVSLVGEPKTTVLRWATYLEEKQLISRREDVKDRRLVRMVLTHRGQDVLDNYFTASPE